MFTKANALIVSRFKEGGQSITIKSNTFFERRIAFLSWYSLFSKSTNSTSAPAKFLFDGAIKNLEFSEKRITKDIKKTINSAVANAENNFQYDIDKLVVKEAYCGKKITMKRFRPRAKGRAAPILKPYSSVTIILSESKNMESHGSKS